MEENSDIIAVLVGCSFYPEESGLESIIPVIENIRTFRSLLTDPEIFGLSPDRVFCLEDPRDTRTFVRFVADKIQFARSTLLFYYAGHGLISDSGALLFPTRDTDRFIVRATSVEWDYVKQLLIDSPARRRFIILDCCYSGRMHSAMGEQDVKAALDTEGAVAIAAASRNKAAHYLDNEQCTAFSQRLFGVFREGIVGAGRSLNALEVFDETRRRIAADPRLPRPELIAKGGLGLMPLVSNKAFDARLKDVDQTLSEKIWNRVGVIAAKFEAKAHQEISYEELQSLARPIKGWAIKLNDLSIVNELMTLPSTPATQLSAGVFAAAIIVYERRASQFFDGLVEFASKGRPVRGAPMWRVLRALKRIVPDIEPTNTQRERLLVALANCARYYDSRPGNRFREYDVLRMIRDIVLLRRLGLRERILEIFSTEQMGELEQTRKAKPTKHLANSGAQRRVRTQV